MAHRAAAVHARGGRIVLQLWHAGRLSDPEFLGGALPVAPSAVAIRGEVKTPRGGARPSSRRARSTRASWSGSCVSFARRRGRAMAAAFDGVEIHAAQGYLLDQFLRDGANRRDDAYGGTVERRARLLFEVVDAVREVVRRGPGRRSAVAVEHAWGTCTTPIRPAPSASSWTHLAPLGLAYLHVFEPLTPGGAPRLSPALRASFRGTFIANGGYDASTATGAIERGDADLVSFGRPFIANPDLVARFRAGAPVAVPDPSTFYGGDARGYTDYPVWRS